MRGRRLQIAQLHNDGNREEGGKQGKVNRGGEGNEMLVLGGREGGGRSMQPLATNVARWVEGGGGLLC